MVANAQGFSDTHDNQKNFGEANHAKDTGPYVATVKTVTDPLRMGRLGVNIPARATGALRRCVRACVHCGTA